MSVVSAPLPVLTADEVTVGDELPGLRIELTATVVIGTALASRDFEVVHHDRDAAREHGLTDVFLNILATNGFAVRLVTDWAGADAIVTRTRIRLGLPAYPGDTLTLTGRVGVIQLRDEDGLVDVEVEGSTAAGRHLAGTVTVSLPRRTP